MFYLPLTQCLEKIIDNRGKTVPTCDSGIPLIATNCIKMDNIYPIFDKVRYISQDIYNTWFRAHLQPNDILFVNKGTPGKVALCPDPLNFVIAQDAIGLRANKDVVYWKYLYYYLKSTKVQSIIENNNVGLIIPHFKKDFLDRITIPIVPMEVQKKIGDTLYDIDMQIQRNNAMVHKLQVLGNTIYSKTVATTSKWETIELSQIKTGKENANFATTNGKYDFFTCSEDSFLCDKYAFEGKSILIAGNGNFNIKFVDGQFNAYQRVYVLSDEQRYGNLYYTYLKNISALSQGANGSIIKFLTLDMVRNVLIPVFSRDINKLLNDIILKTYQTNKQTKKLNELKQSLLPLLINGQLCN